MGIPEIIIRFALATLCGSVIGFQRGRRNHAAGLRTHILVCVGAASTMMVNQYITANINPSSDPARMGAQVISGIGFLGAGTIIMQRHQVKGLTTAAGLWAAACMGLLVGIGFYEGAVIMCFFLYAVIAVLNDLDERYLKGPSFIRIYMEYQVDTTPFSAILKALRTEEWHISEVEFLSQSSCGSTGVLLDLHNQNKNSSGEQALSIIRSVEGVLFAEET